MAKPQGTPIEPGMIERVAGSLRYMFTGQTPVWFGPMEPLRPLVDENQRESVVGRQMDFAVGYNQRTQPRSGESITFPQMRALADAYDILRLVIETRKDQMAKLKWRIGPVDPKVTSDARCDELTAFFRSPDKEHSWDDWLRLLLEDLLVLDAPTLYVRPTLGNGIYSLEPIDGATIKRVLDEHGRTPIAPLPAYQQILKGVPAVNYTRDELIYRPRNIRTHKVYGFSPVEQIVMTVNIALRRQVSQLQYFTEGNIPEALISVPKEWNPDQIKAYQNYWDSLIEGDTAARRHLKFVPGEMNYQETRQPPLKDEFDEWLARVVCFCFSIEPTPFIKQVNRSVAETSRQQSLEEGLNPLMNWVANTINFVITQKFGYADLAFSWQEEETATAKEKADVHSVYLTNKVLTPDEVRQELGREPMTPEEREAAWPTPVFDPFGMGGEPTDPTKSNKATGSEAVAKAKKALGSIDRNRRSIGRWQQRLQLAVRKFLRSKVKDVSEQVVKLYDERLKDDTETVKRILAMLDFSDWVELAGDESKIKPILEEIAKDGVYIALEQIGMANDEAMVKLANQKAIEWANSRAAEWVGKTVNAAGDLVENPNADWRIDSATREMLRSTVTQALDEGWSNDELADAIQTNAAFSDSRAEMIARTETAFADVNGNMTAYRESGQVVGKKWITGDGCCDDCQELDGVVVGLDDVFPNGGGDAPPLHPNCRCDVVPILSDEEPTGD